MVAGEEFGESVLLDSGVQDLVEHCRLECRNIKTRSGLVDGGDGGGGGGAVGELAEDAAFDFEDFGHGFLCGGKVSCRVQVAGVDLVFGGQGVGGAEEVDCFLWVAHDDGSADLVVVLEEAEALWAEAVGEALGFELLEGAVGVDDGGGVYISDFDGEAVAGEVASLEFVGVEVDPLDGEFWVVEEWEVFGCFAWGVDGHDLLGDGVFVFEPGVADGAFVDFEMACKDGDELECGDASFFDEEVDVFAGACGLVEWDFLDLEVFWAVFEGAGGAGGVAGEVDGGGDGGVEGGELGGGGGHWGL